MLNVYTLGQKAQKFILENGGQIIDRDTEQAVTLPHLAPTEGKYDVEVPSIEGMELGGYTFHRGNCTLYKYPTLGKMLDFTVAAGDHTLYLKDLK